MTIKFIRINPALVCVFFLVRNHSIRSALACCNQLSGYGGGAA